MTNLFIANRYQVVKNTEDCTINEGMIEKLDEMLTEYGVKHFFTLPDGDANGSAIDQDAVVNVFYDDDTDSMTFFLVYALWSKTVRKISDKRIIHGIEKYIGRKDD